MTPNPPVTYESYEGKATGDRITLVRVSRAHKYSQYGEIETRVVEDRAIIERCGTMDL